MQKKTLLFSLLSCWCFSANTTLLLNPIRTDKFASQYYYGLTKYGNTFNRDEFESIYRLLEYQYKKRKTSNKPTNIYELGCLSREKFYFAAFTIEHLLIRNENRKAKEFSLHLLSSIQILSHSEKIVFYCKITRSFLNLDDEFVSSLVKWIQTRLDFFILDSAQKFNVFFLLGSVYQSKNQSHLADFYFKKTLPYLTQCTHQERIVFNTFYALNNIRLGKFDLARELLNENNTLIHKRLYFSSPSAQSLLMNCVYYLDKQPTNVDSLKFYANEALKVSLELDEPRYINRSYRFLSSTMLLNEKIDEALACINQAISVDDSRIRQEQFLDSIIIAKIYLGAERYDEFKAMAKNILPYLERPVNTRAGDSYLRICELMVEFHTLHGAFSDALHYKTLESNELNRIVRKTFESKAEEFFNLSQQINKELSLVKMSNKNTNLEKEAVKTKSNFQILLMSLIFLALITIVITLLFRRIAIQKRHLEDKTIFISEQYTRLDDNKTLLETALAEKSILINELHHRVKNNLQFITSSINVQYRENPNISFKEFTELINSRINVLAISFKKLSVTKSNVEVNISEFLEEVCQEIILFYQGEHGETSCTFELENLIMTMSDSIYLGMVVNEAITNAFKHGFSGAKINNKEIKVSLKHSNDWYLLSIQNNGKSISDQVNRNEGLNIMKALAHKLKGKLEINNVEPHGTVVKLEFKYGKIA